MKGRRREHKKVEKNRGRNRREEWEGIFGNGKEEKRQGKVEKTGFRKETRELRKRNKRQELLEKLREHRYEGRKRKQDIRENKIVKLTFT